MATEEPQPTNHGQTMQLRISRGATVMATDGALGTVYQIIMDQRTGELQALVVATDGTEYLEVPATHVLRSTGSEVYLDVSLTDLRQHPDLAKPYNPDQYVPVRENPFLPPSEASRGAQFSERPVVTNIERDAVGVVVPTPSTEAEDIVTSMTTPEAERYVTEPEPSPTAPPVSSGQTGEPTAADTHLPEDEHTPPDRAAETPPEDMVNPRTGSVAPALDTEAAQATPEPAPVIPANNALAEEERPTQPAPVVAPAKSTTEAVPPPTYERADILASEPPVEDVSDVSDVSDVMDVSDVAGVGDVMGVADVTDVESGEGAPVWGEEDAIGLENAMENAEIELGVPVEEGEEEEEAAFMDESMPPVNPVNPGVASETIQQNQHMIPEALSESEESHTHAAPPGVGMPSWERERMASASSEAPGARLAWIPAVMLGALIAGIAVWSTLRAIRRGRRKAAKAARTARASVRGSVRDAGKSAAELAQTVRASAVEVAANPRGAASDALSNFSDIPARYRWFRRGVRVGSRAAKLRGR